jgi:hypothetical protein
MTYTAIVRKDNSTKHMTYSDYTNKAEMKNELQSNGYTVLAILTDTQIETIKNTRLYGDDKEYKFYVQQQL